MTNKEKMLKELDNNVEKLAKLLINCKDITGWDEIPIYQYITSDGTIFDNGSSVNAFEEAVKHEIEWLNSKA